MKPKLSFNAIFGFAETAIEKSRAARLKYHAGGEVDPRLTINDAEKLLEKNKKWLKHDKPRSAQPKNLNPYAKALYRVAPSG